MNNFHLKFNRNINRHRYGKIPIIFHRQRIKIHQHRRTQVQIQNRRSSRQFDEKQTLAVEQKISMRLNDAV